MSVPAPPPRRESSNPSRIPRLAVDREVDEPEEVGSGENEAAEAAEETKDVDEGSGNEGSGAEAPNQESPIKTKGILAAQRRARRERDADLPIFKSGYDQS